MFRQVFFLAILALAYGQSTSRSEYIRRNIADAYDCASFVSHVTDGTYEQTEEQLLAMGYPEDVANGTASSYSFLVDFNTTAEMRPFLKSACKVFRNQTSFANLWGAYGTESACETNWNDIGYIIMTYILAVIFAIAAGVGGSRYASGNFGMSTGIFVLFNIIILFAGVLLVATYNQDQIIAGNILLFVGILGFFVATSRARGAYILYAVSAFVAMFILAGYFFMLGFGTTAWNLQSTACQGAKNLNVPGAFSAGAYGATVYCNVDGWMMSCDILNSAATAQCDDCGFLVVVRIFAYLAFWLLPATGLIAVMGADEESKAKSNNKKRNSKEMQMEPTAKHSEPEKHEEDAPQHNDQHNDEE
jgi:hypothetical protein